MQFIKGVLSLILVVCVIGAGLYVWRNHLPAQPLTWNGITLPQLPQVNISQLQALQPAAQVLIAKGTELVPQIWQSSQVTQIGSILGAKSESDEPKTLKPQAFEVARYNYCQEVTKDYQQRYSPAPTPAESSL
jgi:hypothetical protein